MLLKNLFKDAKLMRLFHFKATCPLLYYLSLKLLYIFIIGGQDLIINEENYKEAQQNLPLRAKIIEIEGLKVFTLSRNYGYYEDVLLHLFIINEIAGSILPFYFTIIDKLKYEC